MGVGTVKPKCLSDLRKRRIVGVGVGCDPTFRRTGGCAGLHPAFFERRCDAAPALEPEYGLPDRPDQFVSGEGLGSPRQQDRDPARLDCVESWPATKYKGP